MAEEKDIIELVEKRVEEELKEKISPDMFGYINVFEQRKKEILKKEYGIDIQTTQESKKYLNVD